MKKNFLLPFVLLFFQSGFSSVYNVDNLSIKDKFMSQSSSNQKLYFKNRDQDDDKIEKAQVNESKIKFELGIRDEFILLFANHYNDYSGKVENTMFYSLPFNLHACAGIRFLNYFKIDLRAGLLWITEDFLGFDKGIYLQSLLFSSNIYVEAGIDFFNGIGNGHTNDKYTFYCFGLGYEPARNFDIDLLFSVPNTKIYGYTINDNVFPTVKYENINNGLLRFGFEYLFNF